MSYLASGPKLKTMKATHVYSKGKYGWGIFYCLEDCLVFYTIFSVLVREMSLTVLAFCLMFNHIHALFANIGRKTLTRFQMRLFHLFVRDYNEEYRREGGLFHRPFGRSTKVAMKKIVSCIAYIFNNPVAGNMCSRAVESRWTLLAYHGNAHPFSARLVKRNCRFRMRNALKEIDSCFNHGKYLNYKILKRVFRDLTAEEKKQVTDYIIVKYNFLDYKGLEKIFGSWDKSLVVIDATAGAEHELEDEYGDHFCYLKMLTVANRNGYRGMNPEALGVAARDRLAKLLRSSVNPPREQLRKFLHLDPAPWRRRNRA